MQHTIRTRQWPLWIVVLIPLMIAGCDLSENQGRTSEFDLSNCSIPTDQLARGCDGPDCIPALNNPKLVSKGADGAQYLSDSSRVIGLLFDNQAVAIPHNILWFHEIVNFDRNGQSFAVTYCPLTGSSLAFDRSAVNGAQLRVSGLLFKNNLVIYDRQENRSLWPQMDRKATCGQSIGTKLQMLPIIEMRWDEWRGMHPNTEVVSNRTGFTRRYTESNYPYGDYERKNNDRVLYDMGPLDDTRPPKERVLGIPDGDGGLALPFGELRNNQSARVLDVSVAGKDIVVFWNSGGQAAMAYDPTVNGQTLSFEVENGTIVDQQEGRTWSVDGRTRDGSTQLDPVSEAYVSFWFAWAAFQPDTRVWTDGG